MKNNKKHYYSIGDKIGIYIIKEPLGEIKVKLTNQNAYVFEYLVECEKCGNTKKLNEKYLRNKEIFKPPRTCINCYPEEKNRYKKCKIDEKETETISKKDKKLFDLAIFGDRNALARIRTENRT